MKSPNVPKRSAFAEPHCFDTPDPKELHPCQSISWPTPEGHSLAPVSFPPTKFSTPPLSHHLFHPVSAPPILSPIPPLCHTQGVEQLQKWLYLLLSNFDSSLFEQEWPYWIGYAQKLGRSIFGPAFAQTYPMCNQLLLLLLRNLDDQRLLQLLPLLPNSFHNPQLCLVHNPDIGSIYLGEYRTVAPNLCYPHGQGLLILPTRPITSYIGQFVHDQLHGHGCWSIGHQAVYRGPFWAGTMVQRLEKPNTSLGPLSWQRRQPCHTPHSSASDVQSTATSAYRPQPTIVELAPALAPCQPDSAHALSKE